MPSKSERKLLEDRREKENATIDPNCKRERIVTEYDGDIQDGQSFDVSAEIRKLNLGTEQAYSKNTPPIFVQSLGSTSLSKKKRNQALDNFLDQEIPEIEIVRKTNAPKQQYKKSMQRQMIIKNSMKGKILKNDSQMAQRRRKKDEKLLNIDETLIIDDFSDEQQTISNRMYSQNNNDQRYKSLQIETIDSKDNTIDELNFKRIKSPAQNFGLKQSRQVQAIKELDDENMHSFMSPDIKKSNTKKDNFDTDAIRSFIGEIQGEENYQDQIVSSMEVDDYENDSFEGIGKS